MVIGEVQHSSPERSLLLHWKISYDSLNKNYEITETCTDELFKQHAFRKQLSFHLMPNLSLSTGYLHASKNYL